MIGQTISHYRISEKIGQGGMGEVYRATDTRLNREVALKVLPEAFADDPQRMGRFSREAQVLASFSHPNIAAIHGLEEADGKRALVMELVEGEDLSERIARGAIPLEEALPIALQIAEALEAAHEKGIIHRDLKPANIKITPEGNVKVLDFGLAKALEQERTPKEIANSPTLTMQATQAGIILGTAAYMSPEQARGKPVDKRADIWAFGCVLYEMLCSNRAFQGEDASDTMAAVLRAEVDNDRLPSQIPPSIRRLLRRCLVKDPHQRIHDIADVRIEIQSVRADDESGPLDRAEQPPALGLNWKTVLTHALALFLGAVVAAVWSGAIFRQSQPPPSTRFVIRPPAEAGTSELTSPVVSPDGRHLLYLDGGRLFLHSFDEIESRLLPYSGVTGAFFSSDSKRIGFFSEGWLKQMPRWPTRGHSARLD